MTVILEWVSQHKPFYNLKLTGNKCDDSCIPHLCNLVNDTKIAILYLGFTDLNDQIALNLFESLNGNSNLSALYLNSNHGISETAGSIILEVVDKTVLHTVDLDGTKVPRDAREAINKKLNIPIEKREIPLRSNTKSANKR